jgi:hypothetical protein
VPPVTAVVLLPTKDGTGMAGTGMYSPLRNGVLKKVKARGYFSNQIERIAGTIW